MSHYDWTRWAADLNAEQVEAVLKRLAANAGLKPTPTVPDRRQRMFTLEMRGHFTEEQGKQMQHELKAVAGRLNNEIEAWGDPKVKPEFAAFSDDFFRGHEELVKG